MIDVVMISTGARPELLCQSLHSLRNNAALFEEHTLTIVYDGIAPIIMPQFGGPTIIHNTRRQFASASRNIGASSIPKYRRQKYVLFLDDDVYMAPRWDEKLIELAGYCGDSILSGYSHPFNHCERRKVPHFIENGCFDYGVPLVISSVAMMMPWSIFDDVGPWDEPGGAGASEDYQICMRAKDKGYGFAVTEPQCVIHTGLTDSSGKRIVGYDELAAQNSRLVVEYGLKGVIFK